MCVTVSDSRAAGLGLGSPCRRTGAGDSSILVMSAVVLSPAQAFAFRQVQFSSTAVDIIQQNQAGSVAKVRVGVCVDSIATAYLLAHHQGIVEDPVIITHRSPVSLVVDLHPALAAILSIHQADGAVVWTQRQTEVSTSYFLIQKYS